MIGENLDADSRACVFQYAKDSEFAWGSACSGTDSPSWVYAGLKAYLQSQQIGMEAPHIVSAEVDASKQKFIQTVACHQQLLDDLFKVICETPPENLMNGKRELADPLQLVKQWIMGFSCKSVSGYNRSSGRGSAPHSLETSTGKHCMVCI